MGIRIPSLSSDVRPRQQQKTQTTVMLTRLVCMLGYDGGESFVRPLARYEGWSGYFVTFSDHLEKKVLFSSCGVVAANGCEGQLGKSTVIFSNHNT